MNITVLGAGAWGTALAIALGRQHAVTLWVRDGVLAHRISSERLNHRYLPGYEIPAEVRVEPSLDRALAHADLALIASPIHGLREILREVALLKPASACIWACKGFEPGSAKLPHEVAAQCLPVSTQRGALSGPSFAQEVAAGKPAALTLASTDAQFAQQLAAALNSARLRIYSATDLIGVELGGALKNVMAIAAGISDGMELGNNARAALVTRGLAEMSRLAAKRGAESRTLMGLTGLGDLVLTCTGDLSRNRQVGLQLAQGEALADILARLGHVAEGVVTTREVMRLAQQLGVDMPITQAVYGVLYENIAPAVALQNLLSREPKPEVRG